jgi:hypothetical protein
VRNEIDATKTDEDNISTAEDGAFGPVEINETLNGVTDENALRPGPNIDKDWANDNLSNGDSSKDAGNSSLGVDGVILDVASAGFGKPLTKLANGETNPTEENNLNAVEERKQNALDQSMKQSRKKKFP